MARLTTEGSRAAVVTYSMQYRAMKKEPGMIPLRKAARGLFHKAMEKETVRAVNIVGPRRISTTHMGV